MESSTLWASPGDNELRRLAVGLKCGNSRNEPLRDLGISDPAIRPKKMLHQHFWVRQERGAILIKLSNVKRVYVIKGLKL